MTEWIKCSDRLPEFGQEIVVFVRMGEFLIFRALLRYSGNLSGGITHWMSLPEPPE